ncbi:nuclear receptor corepressor 2-like [Pollicipes pollicipes]|uniref:nuclear receptor corepressor 2-like n=1 Tax=Pollicipes pollicipes TaxID=41117 RepID=UPI00188494E9|nr:nuclear receptor corepressor 2-like [Pollicipes pollicipes]
MMDSSVSVKQEPDNEPAAPTDSRSDVSANHIDAPYDEGFEAMLITRIQNRIRELGGIGEYDLSDPTDLTPAGRQVKQRFGFLIQDGSDDEQAGPPSVLKSRERGRRRRRRVPDWMLTDVPSDETLRTDPAAQSSATSVSSEPPFAATHPPRRYVGSPESESELSALRDVRAEGGDEFVEAVLWRLQESLRASHNFREYRDSVARKSDYERRAERHHQDTASDDTDEESSRSSAGRVHFQKKVLVRPLGKDPLLTEYRRPYSKVSKQKLSAVKEYNPEPDDPDYEDSLKDKTEAEAAKAAAAAAEADQTDAAPTTPPTAPAPAPKTQPGWKKLFCCVGGAEEPAAKAPPPPKPAAAPPAPPGSTSSTSKLAKQPEVKRKRRKVKSLQVKDLDPDTPNEELRTLHMMFDDQLELCKLTDPDTDPSLDDPSELSDPDSEHETPCFADFLRACGLPDAKVDDYMKYYKTHKGLTDSGHGDWAGTGRGSSDRPSSASSGDDPSWWDKRARERRQDYRRKRREHREYQRQIETQRDLEVESQLRRALETQRELLREREVQREIERTRESSKERKELHLEEEVLEKELLRRLLAELQNEQVRARDREKRRVVARVLEEELITRLRLELARLRERSEERKGAYSTQLLEEEANTRELNNRIEELRRRMEENKILRDYERDEEQQRLQLLEELLVKERRRMDIHDAQRLKEQDLEEADRDLLMDIETQSGEDEAKSQKAYEECAREVVRKSEEHKAIRSKLTGEIRKRELVKRKLISLQDIEKTNPRLFQLAKVMEQVSNEKGCVELEYDETASSSGILKKESMSEGEGIADQEQGTKQDSKTDGEATDGEAGEGVPGLSEDASESPGVEANINEEGAATEKADDGAEQSAEAAGDEASSKPGAPDGATDQSKDPDVKDSENVEKASPVDASPDGESSARPEGSGAAGEEADTVGADLVDASPAPAADETAPTAPGPTEAETTAPGSSDGTNQAEGAPEEAEGPRLQESAVQVAASAPGADGGSAGAPAVEQGGGVTEGGSSEAAPATEQGGGSTEGGSPEAPVTEQGGGSTEGSSPEAPVTEQGGGATDGGPSEAPATEQDGGATGEGSSEAPATEQDGGTTEGGSSETPATEQDGGATDGTAAVVAVVVTNQEGLEVEQPAAAASRSDEVSISSMSGVNDLYEIEHGMK